MPVTAPHRDEREIAIKADEIRTLYRNSATPLVANAVVAALLVATLWSVIVPLHLLVWLVAVGTVLVARTFLVAAYFWNPPNVQDAPRWGYWYSLGALGSGCLWGVAGAFFFVPGNLVYEVLVIFTVMGMALGAIASHACYLPAFYAFSPPAVLPLLVTFGMQRDPVYLVLVVMLFVYIVVLAGAARGQNLALRTSLRLRHEKAELVTELRRAMQAAERANRAKSEFLATMSHELRTPLTAINGFSELIRDEAFGPLGNEQYREYANDIHASGQHLLDLINDILDLSKAEAGKLTIEETALDLCQTAESALRLVRERARRACLRLDAVLPETAVVLQGDPRALKQILLNLLSNAIKFTPAGGVVTLRVGLAQDGGVDMIVGDTGVGMREEDIPTALSPFGQLDNPFKREHPGTGLGLPMVRVLAELHGGELRIDSEPGKGTTVTIHLPAFRVDASRFARTKVDAGGVPAMVALCNPGVQSPTAKSWIGCG